MPLTLAPIVIDRVGDPLISGRYCGVEFCLIPHCPCVHDHLPLLYFARLRPDDLVAVQQTQRIESEFHLQCAHVSRGTYGV